MDIKSISNLIDQFVATEKDLLNHYQIKHPTTIGSMFEGLTAEVLQRSIFEGLDLRVVKNSFIEGSNTEFDVLLVEGDGEPIPYTERYKYKPENVIVVIQVKKNLYSGNIEDGYENLKFISDSYKDKEPQKYQNRLYRDCFKVICSKDINAKELTENENMIRASLRVDAAIPVRIIWGYNGFASEYNFRESTFSFLSKNLTTDPNNIIGGFGPHNFPSLIICGKYSLIKNNAMPFGLSLQRSRQDEATSRATGRY